MKINEPLESPCAYGGDRMRERANALAHSERERGSAAEQRETEALGNNDKNFGREKLIFNVSDNAAPPMLLVRPVRPLQKQDS